MYESEEMDAASHDHDFARMMKGLKSIEEMISYLLDFTDENGETLILFTSDNETGGLALDDIDYESYPSNRLK